MPDIHVSAVTSADARRWAERLGVVDEVRVCGTIGDDELDGPEPVCWVVTYHEVEQLELSAAELYAEHSGRTEWSSIDVVQGRRWL